LRLLRLRDRSLAFQFGLIVALDGLLLVLGDALVGAFLRSGDTARAVLIEAGLSFILFIPPGYLLIRLYRSIARPLESLSDSIRRYQDGDLSARVTPSSAATSEVGYLERSFNSMGERIELMVGGLREVDRLKTEFVSTVSHELKTPLTAISGYVRLMLAGDAGPLSLEQKEFLGIVDSNAMRLTSLINDLLDVSRMEGARVVVEKSPFDLRDALEECGKTLRVLADSKKLEFSVRVPEAPLRIDGDRDRVIQAILNIGSNAVKYTVRGRVSMDAEVAGESVVITISDTGIGMTQAEMSRLFEKFYRVRSKLSEQEGGTGLGLVIARGWIEAHGGAITVDSTLGEGSKVRIILPLLSKVETVADTTGRILLIQSDADLRSLLARALERRGYVVDQLDRGATAVERIRTGGYRAVVIDSRLKDLSGAAVLELWKRSGAKNVGAIPALLIGEGTQFRMDAGLDRLVSALIEAFD